MIANFPLPSWANAAIGLALMLSVLAGLLYLGDKLIDYLLADDPPRPPAMRTADADQIETETEALQSAINRANAGYFVGHVPDAWQLERDALIRDWAAKTDPMAFPLKKDADAPAKKQAKVTQLRPSYPRTPTESKT